MKSEARERLLKELPSHQEMEAVMDGFLQMDHRAGVITAAAYLEHSLRLLIRERMRPALNADDEKRLFDGGSDAALNSFSAKISVAYAFQIIGPKTKAKLILIKDIRNVCAHTLHSVNFNDDHFKKDVLKFYDAELTKSYNLSLNADINFYGSFIGVIMQTITFINHRLAMYYEE